MKTDGMKTGVDEPPFWDDQLHRVPWCVEVLDKAERIRDEILDFVGRHQPFMPYPKYGNLYNNTWDAFPLSVFQGEHIELSKRSLEINMSPLVKAYRKRLPVTSSVIGPLEAEGALRNVFVSRLIPGSVINPHRGWTPDFMRIHLGLQCDPGCRITVGDQTRTWEPLKLLAFKDGGPHLHSVIHEGSTQRIVISHDLRLSYLARFIPEVMPGACEASRCAP
jgi:aspartyl/asparaginyl beta-hydroxylase (cupin superfamily)